MDKFAGKSLSLFIFRMGGAFAALISNLLLAKYVEPDQLGVMLTMISIAVIGSILPFLSLDAAVIRFLKQYVEKNEIDNLHAYLSFLIRICKIMILCIVVICCAFALYSLSLAKHIMIWVWLPLIPASILLSWMRFRSQIANANGEVVYSTIGRSFARPVVFLLGIVVFTAYGLPISPFWISLIFMVSILVACILQYFLISPLPSLNGTHLPYKSEWVTGGLSLGITLLFQEFLVDILIIIAALTVPSEEVAVFAIALRLVAFARFSVMAVDMSFRPIIAQQLAANNHSAASTKLKSSAKMRIYFALLSLIGLMIAAEIFHHFFGGIFTQVRILIPILIFDVIVVTLLGSPHFVLGQTEHATYLIPITIGTIAALVIGVYFGGKFGGLYGVALTSTIILSSRLVFVFILTFVRTHYNSSLIPLAKIRRSN